MLTTNDEIFFMRGYCRPTQLTSPCQFTRNYLTRSTGRIVLVENCRNFIFGKRSPLFPMAFVKGKRDFCLLFRYLLMLSCGFTSWNLSVKPMAPMAVDLLVTLLKKSKTHMNKCKTSFTHRCRKFTFFNKR